MIGKEEIDSLIKSEWDYLKSERGKWSLLEGEQDMEVLEHVLRCILHMDLTKENREEFRECIQFQNPDGGWSKESHAQKTSIWITSFVGLKLCRGNIEIKDSKIQAAVDKTLEYILSKQEADGHWFDPEWSHLNTTCAVTSFLTIYQITQNKINDERINKARVRGFEFIKAWQTDLGLWKDDKFYPAGIETTAHLIQYTLVPAYFMDKIEYAEKMCIEAADALVVEQVENGSWDNENTDHTMDACRNLMLVSDTFKDKEKYSPIIAKGVRWLIDIKNEKGWGDFPDFSSNIERTADGLDTLLKYRRYCNNKPMSDLWAYSK